MNLPNVENINYWDYLYPLLPILYAEMHHTLLGFSLIKRAMPEILSDSPTRIEPGHAIPLLVLIKDADRYPILLDMIRIRLLYPGGKKDQRTINLDSTGIDLPLWHQIIQIQPRPHFSGFLEIDVEFQFSLAKKPSKMHTIRIDNYRGTSKKPLRIFIASDPHPKFQNWYLGDLHVHSHFTNDQVEFGAPLQVTTEMAHSMGISFFAATDHSYDLDDMQDDYMKTDPTLKKWRQLHKEARDVEQKQNCICIPGEEVTCCSTKGHNIHLLLLNNKKFIPGSGDSFERWFKTRSEKSLSNILLDIGKEHHVLAFAAHPEDGFPWIQRILIKRGKWSEDDYDCSGLNGLEILNGKNDKYFRKGLKIWIKRLLEGKKLFVVAGTDSHGNFNRFRQLRLPFLAFSEKDIHVFGWAKTAVILKGKPTRNNILKALAEGASTITTGPVFNLEIKNQKGKTAILGQTLIGSNFHIRLRGRSSEEYGKLRNCKIWLGDLETKKESLKINLNEFKNDYYFDQTMAIDQLPASAYLRGALYTAKDNFCFTNPIWFYTTP